MPNLLSILKPVAAFLYRKYEAVRLKNLVDRGLVIGKNVYINRNVQFDGNHPHLIEIEDNCRISSGVRFLSHDATTFRQLGATRVAKVRILEGTFIGEYAIILPGVTIGPNALIAAGAVVNRDIGENMCAAGNPARPYGKFSDLLERTCKMVTEENLYDIQAYDNGDLSTEEVCRLCDLHGTVFFKGLHECDSYYINKDLTALEQEHNDALETLWRMKDSQCQFLSETKKDS